MLMDQGGSLVKVVHPERVLRAARESPQDGDLEALGLIYRALGDPTRLKMVCTLMGGEMCVYDLAAVLGKSESAVSHQLRRLKDLKLLKSRRDGQVLYYSLSDRHVSEILAKGLAHVSE